MKKLAMRKFSILHSKFELRNSISVVALLTLALSARANDLTVDRRSIRLDESVTVIVSLEDSFALVDTIDVPMKNLVADGEPAVSSEFSWINGTVVRRKTFRFTARPIQAGPALVGPLVVAGEGGKRETLAPVSLHVTPDVAAVSNDPLTILRELTATNRELFFMTAEADKTSAYTGEEVVVTWYLYNAARVQRWQITRVPKLPDFWSEELDIRNEPPSQVLVGNQPMEKVALRRVAIFPLHSGTLTIGGMEVGAEILRRGDDSPFGIFEGSLVEVRSPSAALPIDVRPLPVANVDVVGEVTLDCNAPMQRAGGPVTMQATLRGRANLRTAPPPHFESAVAGETEVQQLPLKVDRVRDGVTMTRRWSYVIFPTATGTMTIPPLIATVFDPRAGRRDELRCAATTLEVQSGGQAPSPVPPLSMPAGQAGAPLLHWIGAIALALLAIGFVARRLRRSSRLRREVREITNRPSPAEVREAAQQMLARRGIDANAIAKESSDRGDAWRALRSLLTALEHDRAMEIDAARDLDRRVHDLIQSLR
jgi:oxygen tolerance protein BatD